MQSHVPLFVPLATVAERRVDDFNAQELANTAWTYAKAEQSDARLLATMARMTERRMADFKVAVFPGDLCAVRRPARTEFIRISAVADAGVLREGIRRFGNMLRSLGNTGAGGASL